ncbi:MAG: ECF-type sigma factor [Gemmataceae bacterium]|nr:ECF-type sigma factor [Gemmataceae bacterium]
MPDRDSITQWLEGLKAGEQEAARRLWESYFHKLVRLVRRKLPGHARRVFDEEDVALSAFKSFCAGVAQDRFPTLGDRDNLWAVLVVLASRKARAYVVHQNRQKRGGGKVQGESGLGRSEESATFPGLDAIAGPGPTPELAAQFAEECQRLLDGLGDDTLQAIALLKMQGHTLDEIAEQVGCTRRAVQRRLEIIRRTWRASVPKGAEEDP